MNLTEVMQFLYEHAINCRISSFWDGGFDVYLGDENNGYKEQCNFDSEDLDKAAEWLYNVAVHHYPLIAIEHSNHN